jgi:hypothetical protein
MPALICLRWKERRKSFFEYVAAPVEFEIARPESIKEDDKFYLRLFSEPMVSAG